ncbi:MAG: hypothetical protein AABX39_00850 [Nanoarchaeota archaeon]
MLNFLSEAFKGWRIVWSLLFVASILSLFNKTLGIWAVRLFGVLIILFFVLGILSLFVSFDKLFKK